MKAEVRANNVPSAPRTAVTWPLSGPLVLEQLIDADLRRRITGLLSVLQPRPRSYQGVVDPELRRCEFVPVPNTLAQQISHQVMQQIEAATGLVTATMAEQASLLYRYGPGVGFVAHHDEVTEVELERSRRNGQPVIGGDLSVVSFLNGPREYVGGALFFEEPAMEVKPPAGTVVVFPATRAYMHGIRAIIGGQRLSMLTRLRITGSTALPPRLDCLS